MCQPKQFSRKTPEGNKYNRRTDVLYIPATIALFLSAMIISTFRQQRQCDQSKTDLKFELTNEHEWKLRVEKAHRLNAVRIADEQRWQLAEIITADYEKQLDELWKSCNSTDNELKAKLEAVEKSSANMKSQLEAKLEAVEKNSAETKSFFHQVCIGLTISVFLITCCWIYTYMAYKHSNAVCDIYQKAYEKANKDCRDVRSRVTRSIQCSECFTTASNAAKLCRGVIAKLDELYQVDNKKVVTNWLLPI